MRDGNRRKLFVPLSFSVIYFQLNAGYLIVSMNRETRSRFVDVIHFETLSKSCEKGVVLVMSVRLIIRNHETTHLLLEVFFWHFILGVVLLKLVENIQVLLKSEKMTPTLHECLHMFWASLVTSITMVPSIDIYESNSY